MARYITFRFGQTVVVVVLVTLLTFILINVAPGDPVTIMLEKKATPETVRRVREQLGLDKSYSEQYWNFLKGVVTGNLGKSYFQREAVVTIVLRALKVTLKLGGIALFLSVGIGLFNGIIVAVFRGMWIDRFTH